MSRHMNGTYLVYNTGTVSLQGPLDILHLNSTNYNLKPKDMLDLFYLINISIMEAVEHCTHILNHLV